MPSLEPRRRSRARFEEDDEDEEQASGSDSSKRQRRNTNGALSEEEEEEEKEEQSDNSEDGNRRSQVNGHTSLNGLANDPGAFHPGAIVRVLVRNFVTYEHAEFLPGPNLNMVIGPNGTGKSSLVCAICLGLGYHPKNLGRASQFGEFVKHGKDNATIEVELQKRPGEPANHVIRVQITREDNSRKWWLNGKEITHKAIQQLVGNLRIQIDNLCQFLPQDKVAEFAGLTPIQLLHETLRAAAPEEMINWQDQLKDLHKDHKKVKEQVETCAETLKGHENRQQGMQGDVDRLHEREAIQKKIEDLRSARAVAEYNDARRKYKEAKQKSLGAKKRLQELEQASGPTFEAVNRKQEYKEKIEPVVADRKKGLKAAETTGDQLLRTVEQQDEKIKGLEAQRTAEERSFASRRADLGKLRKTITELEAKLKNKPPEFVAGDWNIKIRQKEGTLRENEAEKREFHGRFEELKAVNLAKKEKLQQIARSQANLASKEGQTFAYLKKVDADAAKGWEWLKENQKEFEKEIFGPPMLTCSVTDLRYSDIVQSLLSHGDFCCFTAQTRNDHKKLSDRFYKQMGLSVTIRTCWSDLASFRAPLPKDQARALGLDGFAIDYLEGPDPVLAMLCAEKRLHASAVALQDVSNDQYEQIVTNERISSFAAGKTMYRTIRRREYGPNAVSTTTRKVFPGRFWTEQPIDNSEGVELQRQKNELTGELEELKQQGTELKIRMNEKTELDGEIRGEIDELKLQKNELQKAATHYATLGDRIATEQQTLESNKGQLAECRQRIFDCSSREDRLTIERARSALQHREQLSRIHDAYQALLEAQIRLIEAESDVKGLEERNADIKHRLDEVRAEIANAKGETDRLKKDAERARTKVEQAVAEDNTRLPYLSELVEGKTVEDLDDEIEAEKTKLGFSEGIDPSVLRQFKKRAHEIKVLTNQKEELTGKLESLAEEMERLMQIWEPRVDEVISKINDAFGYNFEQISCAGEVGVHKDEDFEQWAIVIKVKFRENETLQQLNQHRQSGGERAVSTIFYLMALQSMAQAPFRVVDEINQGMDPRNERMVHERMVEIACREHTSQYFLITPKLLTGLRYDERMRILCIASGEHMPAQGRKMDFGRLVQIQRGMVGAAA